MTCDPLAPSAGPPEGICDTGVSLLAEWFAWWASATEVPAKMPASLHVRTAVWLTHERLAVQDVLELRGGVGSLRNQQDRDRVWASRHLLAHTLAQSRAESAGGATAAIAAEQARLVQLITGLDAWLAEPTTAAPSW